MPPSSKPNVTGFDPRKFAQSSGMPANDPWARAEQWRYTGPFTRYNRFKGALPGLGTATVAFAAYCTYEYFFMKDEHHGQEHGHGNEEHH
ncbi:hypothetical protein BDR22DRAFT_835383 [Usnea florida]